MKYLLTILLAFGMWSSVMSADFSYGQGSDEAQDSYISDGAATTNYNTGNINFARKPSINQAAILRFSAADSDISGETISSATLTVYIRITGSFGTDHTLYLHRVRTARDWVLAEVTWNIFKTSNNWGTAGALNTTTDIISTATASFNPSAQSTGDYAWEIDVTDDVQAWADGDNNQGWVISASTPGTSTQSSQIWSANWGNSATRPLLEITTGVAVTASPQVIMIN